LVHNWFARPVASVNIAKGFTETSDSQNLTVPAYKYWPIMSVAGERKNFLVFY